MVWGACQAPASEQGPEAKLKTLLEEQQKINQEIKDLEQTLSAGKTDELKVKEVVVMDLEPKIFEHYIQTQGSIESKNSIVVSAKTPGMITKVLVREGQNVSQGQTLAWIDNSLILSAMDEVKSQLELATSIYERQKNLWDQKIGTEVQFLQAKTGKESLEKRLASLQSQNELSKIKSLISGTIDEVLVKLGENTAPGIPAFRVVTNRNLKVVAQVSEAYIGKIKSGDEAYLYFNNSKVPISSKVSFAGKNINPLTRSFIAEVDLPFSEEFRPNMSAVIKFVFQKDKDALVVPVNVIQDINGEKVVFVAEKDGEGEKVGRRLVTVDGIYGNEARIVSGLNPGDKIITVGYQGLNAGERIVI